MESEGKREYIYDLIRQIMKQNKTLEEWFKNDLKGLVKTPVLAHVDIDWHNLPRPLPQEHTIGNISDRFRDVTVLSKEDLKKLGIKAHILITSNPTANFFYDWVLATEKIGNDKEK